MNTYLERSEENAKGDIFILCEQCDKEFWLSEVKNHRCPECNEGILEFYEVYNTSGDVVFSNEDLEVCKRFVIDNMHLQVDELHIGDIRNEGNPVEIYPYYITHKEQRHLENLMLILDSIENNESKIINYNLYLSEAKGCMVDIYKCIIRDLNNEIIKLRMKYEKLYRKCC